MKYKMKLIFSKRDDLDEKNKKEIFDLIDRLDQDKINEGYNEYIKQLKSKKRKIKNED